MPGRYPKRGLLLVFALLNGGLVPRVALCI
jgi:hypothetical protein